MRRRLFNVALSIILLAGAAWVIGTEVRHFRAEDLVRDLNRFSLGTLAFALFFTAVCYLLLTGYDFLAFRYIRKELQVRRIIFTSFISYAFSNNFSAANLTGAAIRYRMYSTWKITPGDITRIVIFYISGSWIGFLGIAGLAFSLWPPAIPRIGSLPFATMRPLGILFLAAVAIILAWTSLRRRPIRIRHWILALPSNRLLLLQILVGSFDWAMTGIVPFVLMPPASSMPYTEFLGIYLLAHLLAMISHLPGGIGVFEAVMLFFLSPQLPSSSIMATLLMYRAIYFLVPLFVGAILFAHFVLTKRKGEDL